MRRVVSEYEMVIMRARARAAERGGARREGKEERIESMMINWEAVFRMTKQISSHDP